MSRCLGVLLLLFGANSACGQFVPQPVYYPAPVYYPVVPQPGVGIYYQSGRVRVSGFFGYPYFAPYATVSNRVSIQVITPPTYVVSSRSLAAIDESYDLAGIDLDARPLAKKPPRGIDEPAVAVAAVKPQPDVKPQAEAKPPRLAPPPDLPPPAGNAIDENMRLIGLGKTAFAERLYGLAAQRFRQAAAVAPFDVNATFCLAQAQFALGRFQEAAGTIEDGMNRDANWPAKDVQLRTHFYKGSEDSLDAHLRLVEEAGRRQPENARFQFLRAHQLWFDGRRAEATAIFQRARPLALDPAVIDLFLRQANQVVIR